MKDVLGRDIKTGDKVAYSSTHYPTMKVGYVTKLTPKGARISPHKTAEASGLWRGSDQICLVN